MRQIWPDLDLARDRAREVAYEEVAYEEVAYEEVWYEEVWYEDEEYGYVHTVLYSVRRIWPDLNLARVRAR